MIFLVSKTTRYIYIEPAKRAKQLHRAAEFRTYKEEWGMQIMKTKTISRPTCDFATRFCLPEVLKAPFCFDGLVFRLIRTGVIRYWTLGCAWTCRSSSRSKFSWRNTETSQAFICSRFSDTVRQTWTWFFSRQIAAKSFPDVFSNQRNAVLEIEVPRLSVFVVHLPPLAKQICPQLLVVYRSKQLSANWTARIYVRPHSPRTRRRITYLSRSHFWL